MIAALTLSGSMRQPRSVSSIRFSPFSDSDMISRVLEGSRLSIPKPSEKYLSARVIR